MSISGFGASGGVNTTFAFKLFKNAAELTNIESKRKFATIDVGNFSSAGNISVAGTIGNSAAEEALAIGPTADTFAILRIEVDSSGNATFFVDDVEKATRAAAVATTSLLIPYIAMDSGTDAQTVTDLTIDYIYFSCARPSSNA